MVGCVGKGGWHFCPCDNFAAVCSEPNFFSHCVQDTLSVLYSACLVRQLLNAAVLIWYQGFACLSAKTNITTSGHKCG